MKKIVQVDVLKELQAVKSFTKNPAAKTIIEKTIGFITKK